MFDTHVDKFGQDQVLLDRHHLRLQHCMLKSKLFEHVASSLAAEGMFEINENFNLVMSVN